MKGKRAQAAMEFLMTYGWAILVVLAAVGILAYLGVFNMQQDVAAVCKLRPTGQGLDCDKQPYINGSLVQFTVVNSNPYDVSDVTASLEECNGQLQNQPLNISRGKTKLVNITGCDFTTGERLDLKFTVDYKGEGQLQSNNAKISATVS